MQAQTILFLGVEVTTALLFGIPKPFPRVSSLDTSSTTISPALLGSLTHM